MKIHYTIFLLVLLALTVATLLLLLSDGDTDEVQSISYVENSLVFKDAEINIAIADTTEERKQGLSGQASVSDGEGLLFVFNESGHHGIWMPDMNFSIDIVWLDESFKVVDIKENATPESYPEVFTSSEPAKFVLEVKSGFTRKIDLSVGDKLRLMDAI